jgi:hypothetical protein
MGSSSTIPASPRPKSRRSRRGRAAPNSRTIQKLCRQLRSSPKAGETGRPISCFPFRSTSWRARARRAIHPGSHVTQERWIVAAELRAGNRKVVHHAHVFIIDPEQKAAAKTVDRPCRGIYPLAAHSAGYTIYLTFEASVFPGLVCERHVPSGSTARFQRPRSRMNPYSLLTASAPVPTEIIFAMSSCVTGRSGK